MAVSDPATVAEGHDVTDSVKSAETKQQEQAAQTIQVIYPFYKIDCIILNLF